MRRKKSWITYCLHFSKTKKNQSVVMVSWYEVLHVPLTRRATGCREFAQLNLLDWMQWAEMSASLQEDELTVVLSAHVLLLGIQLWTTAWLRRAERTCALKGHSLSSICSETSNSCWVHRQPLFSFYFKRHASTSPAESPCLDSYQFCTHLPTSTPTMLDTTAMRFCLSSCL